MNKSKLTPVGISAGCLVGGIIGLVSSAANHLVYDSMTSGAIVGASLLSLVYLSIRND